jgi:hypothetical protein
MSNNSLLLEVSTPQAMTF